MALRRAVPKTPLGSPIQPRSLIHKPRLLSTPSESALPQLLIPLHFNSCISNVYKKRPGGGPASSREFVNSSLSPHRSCDPHTNTRNSIRLICLLRNSCTPQGRATSAKSAIDCPRSPTSPGARPQWRHILPRHYIHVQVRIGRRHILHRRPGPISVEAYLGLGVDGRSSVCRRTPVVLVSALRKISLAAAPRTPQRRKTFSPHRFPAELSNRENSLRRNQTVRSGHSTFGCLAARPLKGTG
jgi:hypothetical protein